VDRVQRFAAAVAEELGDLLWYVAAVASHLKLDLAEIAATNIARARDRWPGGEVDDFGSAPPSLPDEAFPEAERLPRLMRIRFEETVIDSRRVVRLTDESGDGVGNQLRDNSHEDDRYRFHDAMHLAYAAHLGWSPVVRKLLGVKRKSNRLIDEIEDGGRAAVIEEAVVAFVYDYAQQHANLDGGDRLDYQLLNTVKSLTSGLEVARWSLREWEQAILSGFKIWRDLIRDRGGVVVCDLDARTISLE
jgi:hypothetical protein